MTSFPIELHTARKALDTALNRTAPLPAELVERLRAHDAVKYAECERQVAAIAATIPGLQAEYDRLAALACGRCAGTGEYGGASRYMRHGKKFCFHCGGSGKE